MRYPIIVITLLSLLVWRAQAQEVTPLATPSPAAYLPLVIHPAPTNTPTATATAIPVQVNCAAEPNPANAPNFPLTITHIDKAAETVTIQNLSETAIDLTGWTMCSIKGGQRHPISGILTPGQSQTFGHTGGPIWNNNEPDPGALYDPSGKLISYFNS